MANKPYKIYTFFEVDDDDITSLLESALQGITYWCDEVYVRGLIKDQDEGMYTSQALTRGYRIAIHDAEEEKWHQLTLKKLLNGIAAYGRQDFYDWDMYDADRVIQLALFGKVIYA